MSNEEKERYNVFINMFRQPPFELPGMIIGIKCTRTVGVKSMLQNRE